MHTFIRKSMAALRFVPVLLLLAAAVAVAARAADSPVAVDAAGRVTSPSGFWLANSNAINAVVRTPAATVDPSSLTPGVLWVDGVNGDDITAERDRSDLPFRYIQTALSACMDGDTIRIMAGTYQLYPPSASWSTNWASALTLYRRSRVTIEGVGVVNLQAMDHGVILSIWDCTEVTLQGLRFIGLPRPTVANGNYYGLVNFHGINLRPRIHDCYFQGGQHGILHAVRPNRTSLGEFRNNTFRDGGNEFHSVLLWDGAAIAVGGSGNRIQDNTIINWSRGIEIEGGTSDAPSSTNIVSGNLILDVLHEGITVLATTGTETNFAHLLITGNQIGCTTPKSKERPPGGIVITGGSDILVSDNNVRNIPHGTGIMVNNGHAPIRRVSITGNRVSNVGSTGIAIVGGGLRTAEDAVIEDNHITDVANVGLFISASRGRVAGNVLTRITASQAILVGGACQDIVISDNQVDTCSGVGLNIMAGALRTTVSDNWATRVTGAWYVDAGTDTKLRAPFINADSLDFGGTPAFALRRSTSDGIFDVHGGAGLFKGASIRLVGESRPFTPGWLQLVYGGGTPGSPAQGTARLTINRVSGGNLLAEVSAWESDGSFTHRQPITLWETPTPTAPAPNSARLFLRDDGSGRSQLAVRFASGSVVALVTEPRLQPAPLSPLATTAAPTSTRPLPAATVPAPGQISGIPIPSSSAGAVVAPLWLDIPQWTPTSGSEAAPALHTPPNSDLSQQVIAFESDRTDHIQCKIAIPDDWDADLSQLSLTLFWCSSPAPGATPGAVQWIVRAGLRSPGDLLSGSVLGVETTVSETPTSDCTVHRAVLRPAVMATAAEKVGRLLYLDLACSTPDAPFASDWRVYFLGAQVSLNGR